jgi:hypothetical protein
VKEALIAVMAVNFICIIALSAIVSDEAELMVTELCNSLRVAATGILGRSGRHVARRTPRRYRRGVCVA